VRHSLVSLAAVVVFLSVNAEPLGAISQPSFAGKIAGLELCEQDVCGAAVFTGLFDGQIDFRRERGLFLGAVTHDPLPTIRGESRDVTGGFWKIRTLRQAIAGSIVDGTITYNGNDTFTVVMTMVPAFGNGSATFIGTLDHRVFPPGVGGLILQ